MPSLLSPRFDGFKFKFPEYFFPEELRNKYSDIFREKKLIYDDPVEFLNASVVSVSFLGMGNAVLTQQQPGFGTGDIHPFTHPASDQYYRTGQNPLALIDRTFKVTFRHTMGFWNYFFMFETFFYQIMRNTPSNSETLTADFSVELLDSATGRTLSKVMLFQPVIEQIPELNLTYQKVNPESQTFEVTFKFNNIDYQFDPSY